MRAVGPGTTRFWSGRGLRTALTLAGLLTTPLVAQDKEPLHARIDRLVEASSLGPPAPLADDATFLRRLSLDLTGRIPTSREARTFLDDPAPDKRAKLIDRLLASPEHVRHLAITFDIWLMERRAEKHVKTDEWRAWLVSFFAANRPYTELAREVVAADGADSARRAPARFTLDRDVSPDALTRDVGRLFFGMDLQCAQCHDHPRIDDYLQRDYYGLYAFLNRSSLFQPDAKKPAVVMEKADGGEANFKSVFTKAEGTTKPRMPDGAEIREPAVAKGEEYQVKPDPKDKNVRPVPKYSRRAELARLLGEGTSRAFSRNAANRLWALLMGRGLVEPLDLHHSANPPSNPEVLDAIADGFVALNYDVRAFLRELALTRTYQRGIELPATLADEAKAAAAKLPALETEAGRLRDAAAKAEEAVRKATEELGAAKKAVAAASGEVVKGDAAVAEAKKAHDAAVQARDAAQKELAARQDLRKTVAEAAQKAAEAASRLAGDADLSGAAAIFRGKSERLVAEVDALSKSLAEKAASIQPKAEALAAAEKGASAARSRLTGAEGEASSRAAVLVEADLRAKSARIAAAHAASRVTEAKTLTEYAALQASAGQARESVKRIKSELGALREAVSRLPGEMTTREARVEEAKKKSGSAAADSDACRRDLATREETLRTLVEAAVKAEEVAQKAGKDAELVSAAARVKARKERQATEVAELRKLAAGREEERRKAADELAAAQRALADLAGAKDRIPALEAQLKPAAEKAQADQAKRDELHAKVTTIWTRHFAASAFDPLTPEQIGWSMMQATGLVDVQRAAAEAELGKKNPAPPEADRPRLLEEAIYSKLRANEAPYVKLFGGGPGQPQDEFYATVDQALFLENGALVRGWLAPTAGSLAERLMKTEDPKELATELYLSVYTRRPTEPEAQEVARYLAARPQARLAAIQELIWATLTSVEFRFKH